MLFGQFSHKIWIRERSTLKESDPELQKKYRLIRAAWKFEVGFGDIFVHLRCKFENPLFFTFTKDSRFYNVKARKYRQNPLQIFTRHELIDFFGSCEPDSFNVDRSRIHSLWENWRNCICKRIKHQNNFLKIFGNKNFRFV